MSNAFARTLVGLAFALASATVVAAAAAPNATLSNVTGKVSVNQGKEFVPVTSDVRLKPGDRVMVAAKASATITFDDACRLDLSDSKIVIVPSKSTCAGDKVAQKGIGPGEGGSGAAIGDRETRNGGVWIMVGVVAGLDVWMLSEDDKETTSP